MPTSNPFRPMPGFGRAGLAMSKIFSGEAERDAQTEEEKRLSEIDYRMSQAALNAAKLRETETGLKRDAEMAAQKKDPNNWLPGFAASANVPLETAKNYYGAAAGWNGPRVMPEGLTPEQKQGLAQGLNFHQMLQVAKDSNIDQMAGGFNKLARLGMTQAAPEILKADPNKAAFMLAGGNDTQVPKLWDNNAVGTFNQFSGEIKTDPNMLAQATAKSAPAGYSWGPDGKSLVPIPGGPAEFTRTDQQLRRDESTARRDEATALRQDAQTQKKRADLERKVNKFSGELEKTNIPVFEQMLADTENKVKQLASESSDIPGFGPLDSLRPDFLTSDKGKELRQLVQSLANVIIKDRSGAAVSNQEMQRLVRELGTGKLSTEKQLLDALTNIRRHFNETKRNVVAGVDDDTLNEYANNGGMRFERGPGAKPSDNSTKATPPKAGEIRNGFRFKGGNPNDKNSWEPASAT